MSLPREIKILAGLYSFSGFYCAAIAVLLLYTIMTGPWFLYRAPFVIVVGVSLAFFLEAYGLLRRERWARTLGFVLSGLATATMLLTLVPIRGVVDYWLTHPKAYAWLLLGLSSLSLLITNPLCLYYLTRAPVKQYLHKRT